MVDHHQLLEVENHQLMRQAMDPHLFYQIIQNQLDLQVSESIQFVGFFYYFHLHLHLHLNLMKMMKMTNYLKSY